MTAPRSRSRALRVSSCHPTVWTEVCRASRTILKDRRRRSPDAPCPEVILSAALRIAPKDRFAIGASTAPPLLPMSTILSRSIRTCQLQNAVIAIFLGAEMHLERAERRDQDARCRLVADPMAAPGPARRP